MTCAFASAPTAILAPGTAVAEADRASAAYDVAAAISLNRAYLTEADRRELAVALLTDPTSPVPPVSR